MEKKTTSCLSSVRFNTGHTWQNVSDGYFLIRGKRAGALSPPSGYLTSLNTTVCRLKKFQYFVLVKHIKC